MGTLVRREACPKCREAGGDSKGDNLAVYSDGSTYCHAGHGRIGGRMKTEHSDLPSSGLSISDCLSFPIGSDRNRKLKKETEEAFGIRVVYDETTGECKRVYYPYTDASGVPTGFKIRTLPKKFTVAGKILGLYGKQTAHPTPRGSLFITEGEEDAHTLHTLFCSSPTWKEHDVVSIPNGANLEGKIDAAIMNDEAFIAKYRSVVLCMDNDLPGKGTANRLANWLSGFIPIVKIVQLPAGIKDVSEAYTKAMIPDLKAAIISAPIFTPDGIIKGSDITLDDLMRKTPEGYSTPFPDFDRKHHGVRKAEILTVCAGSGVGKSTFVKELGYHLVKVHGLSVCHIALENLVEEVAASYVAMDNNIPTPKFRTNPECIPVTQVEESMKNLVHKMHFFRHFGSIDTKTFQQKLMYYARIGVDFIILDHLSMVISGSDDQNERKQIDKVMTDLATMVVSTGVGLINVVHLKRKETAKDKSFNEGGTISLNDLRGSAALEQLSWSVVGLERNQQADDGSEDYSLIRILKNRTWGFLGKAGRTRYSHETGRMTHVEEDLLTKEVHSVHEKESVIEASESPASPFEESSLKAFDSAIEKILGS